MKQDKPPPQAAVGALMRCRRAVVVGDPQQVEPVVALPDVLTMAMLREFDADPDRFSAPSASVQTLADEASDHCATFATAGGSRTVGAPLLVHRRCASPMFDISSRIAYGGLMVQAKLPEQSHIRKTLGESHWIDVQGTAREKYCPEEGQVLLRLLRTLRQNAVAPDIYVVTPFAAVQDGLRQLVKQDGVLEGWVSDCSSWAYERISTVHTVQGREAEAVIIVLGAPEAGQSGARRWAGSTPNLLNVAVTRAKEAVYVIGNRALWSGEGNFSVLAQKLR
ncbi:MAG: DEAD/DEAH box helicase [Stenotrophomonas sp.]